MNKKRWLFLLISVILVCIALGVPAGALAKDPAIFPTTIEGYLKEYSDACWFCDVFKTLYDAINKLVKTLFNDLAQSFLNLMGLGVLFLLLFKVGKMLVQLQDVDIRQFLNDLFKPLGRAIIATALLTVSVAASNQNIFYILTNPFIEASLRISEQIITNTLNDVKYLKTDSSGKSVSRSSLGTVDFSSINSKYETENSTPPSTALGDANKEMLVAWMKKISSSFIVGIAMGGTFIKIGITGNNFFSKGLPVAIAGFTLWLGFWLMYLFFPMRIMNAFARIAFVLALTPLWIILWVFPSTQQYTKKAWEMFLSGCLIFIVLSVMIALALLLVDRVVPEKLFNSDTGGYKTREWFFNQLIAGNDEEAKKYAGWGSGLILNCIAFTFLGWSMIGKAEVIANSFVGGAGNIQLNVGNQTAATVAKGGNVVMAGAKATANVTLWAGGKVGSKVLQKVRGRFGGSGSSGPETGTGNNGGRPGGPGGGGGTSPSSPKPVGVPGPDGEAGKKGPKGDPATPGKPEDKSLHDVAKPEGTNVREPIKPADMTKPGDKSSTSPSAPSSSPSPSSSAADRGGTSSAISGGKIEEKYGEDREELIAKWKAMPGQFEAEKQQDMERFNLAKIHAENWLGVLQVAAEDKDFASIEKILKNVGTGGSLGEVAGFICGDRTRFALNDIYNYMERGAYKTDNGVPLPETVSALAGSMMADDRENRTIQSMLNDSQAPDNLRKLSQDVAFVERQLGRGSWNNFVQAVQGHEWQTNPEMMQSYAIDMYELRGSPDAQMNRTRAMLHTTYFSSEAAGTVRLISREATSRDPNEYKQPLSKSLSELSDKVAKAQVMKA
ncbi:MAG: hypothetical protein IKS41_06540 [Alphaproteobacteria bacterium]|nr:hypothetical protein [Alphaproteobacteria bacterium]